MKRALLVCVLALVSGGCCTSHPAALLWRLPDDGYIDPVTRAFFRAESLARSR